MIVHDTLTLDAPRRTREGFLVASVRAARTGIQTYTGREADPENAHGFRDAKSVSIYRDESEVFHRDSLRSFSVLDVTVDHPSEAVTADNWKQYAVGVTGEEVVRDGEYIRIPMMLKDAAAIRIVEGGKHELSVGYDTQLDWTPGVTADGLQFDARQTMIRANHISIVDRARGGPELRIGDKMAKIVRDGVPVEVNDDAKIIIDGLDAKITKLTADLAAANTTIGTHVATIATKDGEIAALNAKLGDATLTPAKLDAAVAARAKVVDAAKKILPTIDATGKTDAEIRRLAVAAKLGDAAAAMTDDGVIGAFTVLAASDTAAPDPIRDALRTVVPLGDARAKAEAAYQAHVKELREAHKKTA